MKKVDPVTQLNGTIELPADKSISHRSAMFAALADASSTIENFSEAADPHATLQCLNQLGVPVAEEGTTVTIEGVGREGFKDPSRELDCQNSGTTMRLLSGILGGAGVECTVVGDESLSGRTMKRIIDPLRTMDVEITARDNDYAPMQIKRSKPLRAIKFPLPIASAQLKSCVLLAGLFGEETTAVIETAVSRDHTERLLSLPIEYRDGKKIITSNDACSLPAQNYRVPGDFSAAAYWLVAASVHPNAVIELSSVGINETRTGALTILEQMGADITINNKRKEGAEPVADITVKTSRLAPVDVGPDEVPNCIDELPILMIAMLRADGTSTIHGAEELRHKETDRLAAMAELLETAGASFQEKQDGIVIEGDPSFTPKAGTINSYDDHRIAMTAAVLSLIGEDTSTIKDAECTRISYPRFWEDLQQLSVSS